MRDKVGRANHDMSTRLVIFVEVSAFVLERLTPWLIGSGLGRLELSNPAPIWIAFWPLHMDVYGTDICL